VTTPDFSAEMKRINESQDLARRLARAQFAIEILNEFAVRNTSAADMLWLIELCRKEAE